jgi:hypothetical protein
LIEVSATSLEIASVPYSIAVCQTAVTIVGKYDYYGMGCQGTGQGGGGAACISENWNQTLAGVTGASANFAILANSGNQPRAICSVDLYCNTVSGQTTPMTVWIYDRSATGQPGSILGQGTMQVGGTAGIYNATIVPPAIILPNTDFFVVLDNRVGLRLPIASAGNPNTHYWNGPPTWNGPFSTQRWNFQINCCTGGGGAIPVLASSQVPVINGTFQVNLGAAVKNSVAMLFFGLSDSNWNGIPLPFDLAPFGAPGCSLLAAGHVIDVVATDGFGRKSARFVAPLNTFGSNNVAISSVSMVNCRT